MWIILQLRFIYYIFHHIFKLINFSHTFKTSTMCFIILHNDCFSFDTISLRLFAKKPITKVHRRRKKNVHPREYFVFSSGYDNCCIKIAYWAHPHKIHKHAIQQLFDDVQSGEQIISEKYKQPRRASSTRRYNPTACCGG